MKPVRLGDLSVGFVHTLADAIQSHGLDPQPLLLQYGLDPARLAEAGARLSIPRYMRLGHAAIQLTGEPGLGLRMGQLSRLSQAGLAGVTAAQAPTVREAARTLTRFEALYGSNYRGQSSFHEDAEGAWLRFYSISPYNAYNRFVVDSIIAGWLHQLSGLAQQPVQAQRIEIEFAAPDYADAYSVLGDGPIQFGAESNQLRLNQQTLALRNPQHCPSTWHLLLQLCERELEQTGIWLRDRGMTLTNDWLTQGREFNAVLSNNDEMAIGAAMALKSAGTKPGSVLIAGVDGTRDGLNAIEKGEMTVSVFQDAKGQGIGSVDAARKLANKETIEQNIVIPFQLITPENVKDFK